MSGREPWDPKTDGGYREIVPFPQSLELPDGVNCALNRDMKDVFRAAGKSHDGGGTSVGLVNSGKMAVVVGLDKDMSVLCDAEVAVAAERT